VTARPARRYPAGVYAAAGGLLRGGANAMALSIAAALLIGRSAFGAFLAWHL